MLIGIVIGVLVGSLIMYFLVVKSPLAMVLNDRGFGIYACTSEDAIDVLGRSIAMHTSIKPAVRIDSPDVKRGALSNGIVFNHTSPEAYANMGMPSGAPAFVASNPRHTAIQVCADLHRKGYSAQIISGPREDVPDGAMVFVMTDALVCNMIVFRKRVTKMGPHPPKWRL